MHHRRNGLRKQKQIPAKEGPLKLRREERRDKRGKREGRGEEEEESWRE